MRLKTFCRLRRAHHQLHNNIATTTTGEIAPTGKLSLPIPIRRTITMIGPRGPKYDPWNHYLFPKMLDETLSPPSEFVSKDLDFLKGALSERSKVRKLAGFPVNPDLI